MYVHEQQGYKEEMNRILPSKGRRDFIEQAPLPGLSLKAIKDFLGNNITLANSLPKTDRLSFEIMINYYPSDILNSISFPSKGWSEAPRSSSWQHAYLFLKL